MWNKKSCDFNDFLGYDTSYVKENAYLCSKFQEYV